MATHTPCARGWVFGVPVLLALLGVSSAGCTPGAKDLRARAIDEYRNHQHIESMATLRYVLDLSAKDAQANYYMGLNYRTLAARRFRDGDVPGASKRIDTALLYYTQAIKSWPNYLVAVEAKNEALEARGWYEEALATAEYVAHNNRGDSEHFVFLANEYRERGDYDSALRNYKLALASHPDFADAYLGMGQLYKLVGDRVLAMDAFRRAYELNLRNSFAADELNRLSRAPGIQHAAHDVEP